MVCFTHDQHEFKDVLEQKNASKSMLDFERNPTVWREQDADWLQCELREISGHWIQSWYSYFKILH